MPAPGNRKDLSSTLAPSITGGPDDELTWDERHFPALDEPAFGLDASRSRRVRAVGAAEVVLVPGEGVVAVIDRGDGGVAGVVQLLDGSAVGAAFRGTGRPARLGRPA